MMAGRGGGAAALALSLAMAAFQPGAARAADDLARFQGDWLTTVCEDSKAYSFAFTIKGDQVTWTGMGMEGDTIRITSKDRSSTARAEKANGRMELVFTLGGDFPMRLWQDEFDDTRLTGALADAPLRISSGAFDQFARYSSAYAHFCHPG